MQIFHEAAGDAGAAGGAATPAPIVSGSAPAPAAGGGGQQQQVAAPVAASAPASNGALPPADLRSLINERGEFVSPDWAKQMGLPDGFASKFKTLDGALKSYANLEKSLGSSNKVTIPSENASKEEIALFRSKLGVPESPDGYKIERPEGLPDELWGQDRVTSFQTKAHELGLSAKQATELAKWQAEHVGGDYKQTLENVAAQREATVTELKKDWGNSFEANVALAEKGAAAAGLTPEVLRSTPELSNNPHFIRAMQAVAMKLGEDRGAAATIRGGSAGSIAINTPEAAQAEISRIRMDKGHAYNNPQASARDKQAAVDYVARLYTIKNPELSSR